MNMSLKYQSRLGTRKPFLNIPCCLQGYQSKVIDIHISHSAIYPNVIMHHPSTPIQDVKFFPRADTPCTTTSKAGLADQPTGLPRGPRPEGGPVPSTHYCTLRVHVYYAIVGLSKKTASYFLQSW